MGMIDNTWYWESGDNTSFETAFGSIQIEGQYGNESLDGLNGIAYITGTTGYGIFSISGTGELDRLGVVSNSAISDISVHVTGDEVFDLAIGYSDNGPYATVTVADYPISVDIETDGLAGIYDAFAQFAEPGRVLSDGLKAKIEAAYDSLSEMQDIFVNKASDVMNNAFQEAYGVASTAPGHAGWPQHFECFLAGTPVLLADREVKAIEEVSVGDMVLSYDSGGHLVPSRVSRIFSKDVAHLLDVHGLKVTPGHVTLCGDGRFADRHVPIIDILLSDGALVKEDGSLVRMAINKPVGSLEDQIVKLAYAITSEDAQSGNLQTGEIRVGTLLFDKDGEAVSILDCIRAEGMNFDPETGLVCRENQSPEPLYFFGPLPRPEDYILRRSYETLEGILTDGEWEGPSSELIAQRLRRTASPQLN
jgi:hypothetical protein